MPSMKQDSQAALALSAGRQAEGFSGIALGLAGDSAQAERLAADLSKRFSEDTIVKFDYLPMIQAAIALHSGDGKRAIDAQAASAPYELGETNPSFTFALYPVYLRGEAYLLMKQGSAAAAEFQKIVDHAGVAGNEPIAALAHLGLARAYALQAKTSQGTDADAARARAVGRLQRLSRAMERCRPGRSHPYRRQIRIRQAAIASRTRSGGFWCRLVVLAGLEVPRCSSKIQGKKAAALHSNLTIFRF